MHTLDMVGWIGIMAILVWWWWSSRKIPATKCGHMTLVSGSVTIFGKRVAFRLPVKDGKTDYCLDCVGRMTVYCHQCLRPVIVGDELAWTKETADVPAVDGGVYNRYTCCRKCGSERAGVWVLPGRTQFLPLLKDWLMAEGLVKEEG